MPTTLTDRYIDAAVRTLPADTQSDVRAELTAVIADDIEARLDQGEPRADAEYAVLAGLGDPDVLAARYADRPLHLIGPKYYLTWWRLLKLLWIIVPIAGGAGVLVAQLIAEEPIQDMIGDLIAVVIGSIVHVGFWVTVVFVILERTGADTHVRWTPDQLPEPQETGASRGDLIASLIMLGIAGAVLAWDRFIGLARIAVPGWELGDRTEFMPFLNPELWPFWFGALLVVICLEAALAIAVYVRHGWTRSFAVWNTVLAIAVAILLLVPLIGGRLMNPELTTYLVTEADVTLDALRIAAILTGVVIAGVTAWDAIDGWRKARRADR